MVGKVIRKPFTLIFRESDGSYFGNGYGEKGGVMAALDIREIREIAAD